MDNKIGNNDWMNHRIYFHDWRAHDIGDIVYVRGKAHEITFIDGSRCVAALNSITLHTLLEKLSPCSRRKGYG